MFKTKPTVRFSEILESRTRLSHKAQYSRRQFRQVKLRFRVRAPRRESLRPSLNAVQLTDLLQSTPRMQNAVIHNLSANFAEQRYASGSSSDCNVIRMRSSLLCRLSCCLVFTYKYDVGTLRACSISLPWLSHRFYPITMIDGWRLCYLHVRRKQLLKMMDAFYCFPWFLMPLSRPKLAY